jgi:hypothetical protein
MQRIHGRKNITQEFFGELDFFAKTKLAQFMLLVTQNLKKRTISSLRGIRSKRLLISIKVEVL